MRVYYTLVRRELSSLFGSLIGYVIISAVLFLIGFSFTDLLERLDHSDPTDMPITELFYQTYYFWYILLLASPLITMRSFALEKATGTFETLITTPITDTQVVLAKFTSCLIFHLLMWLPLLACVLIVRHYASDTSAFNLGTVAGTVLGIMLVGALYMAMGCFASALTRNQVVAAMLGFLLGMAVFILSFRSLFGLPQTSLANRLLSYVSMMEHMQDFVRGIVDTRYVAFYVSLTACFLFLTLKAVESRRWR
jgi:ABC-2 type transport system permease protein